MRWMGTNAFRNRKMVLVGEFTNSAELEKFQDAIFLSSSEASASSMTGVTVKSSKSFHWEVYS